MRAAGQDRPGVAAARAAWRAAQPHLDPHRLVPVGEAWASTAMARRMARGRRGERVACPAPRSHGKTTTFVAARRGDRRAAPVVIDGAMTGDHFVAPVRQVRVPALRPGGVVAWDDLGCHERAAARAAARAAVGAAGAEVRFLPAYSPGPNPIGRAFSELKALLRAAEERTTGGLRAFPGRSLDAFAADERGNYFRHAGYTATNN